MEKGREGEQGLGGSSETAVLQRDLETQETQKGRGGVQIRQQGTRRSLPSSTRPEPLRLPQLLRPVRRRLARELPSERDNALRRRRAENLREVLFELRSVALGGFEVGTEGGERCTLL